MEAGLKEFIVAYAKDNNLSDIEVALLAGAMSHEAIAKLPQYANFVLVLNSVAPQLIHYIQLAGKNPNKGDSNADS